MKAYHIDRTGRLEVGRTYQLKDIQNDHLFSDSTKEIYSDGLSYHGLSYLSQKDLNLLQLDTDGYPTNNSYMIDVLYEYERLLHFPSKISRFQSLFVVLNPKDIDYWLTFFESSREDNEPHPRILQIEFADANLQKHDEKFLHTKLDSFSLQEIQSLAKSYWNGDLTETPTIEYLVKPPFTVISEIPVEWE